MEFSENEKAPTEAGVCLIFIGYREPSVSTMHTVLLFPVGYLLAFDDLAVLDAARADLHALRNAVGQRLHRLKIRVPATTGDVVRVGDVVAELRPFAAKITYVCHDFTPKQNLMSR